MLQSSNTMSQAPVPLPDMANLRVLLLDDSSFDCQRIRRLTTKTDLSIALDEVNSIEALDRAVDETPYDLILIDYGCPSGTGWRRWITSCGPPRTGMRQRS